MRSCKQMEGLSVLEHGESVARHYADLHAHLTQGAPLELEWRLPDWLESIGARREIIRRLLPLETAQTYQVYHDCGKPYCLTFDDEGRRHFPNHAEVSYQTWRGIGGGEQVARLMRMDMDAHLLKGAGVPEFAARPESATLLLTALAEIHSNAVMFGGINSTSFKIKWKQLNRRGKAILKLFLESPAE